MKTPLLSWKSITIPAYGVLPHNIAGQIFVCTESSDRFEVQIDDGDRIPMELGLGFRIVDGFTKLLFINEGATAITAEYYVGANEILDNRLNTLLERQILVGQKIPPTVIIPGDTNINAAQTLTYVGVNANRQRKQIVITNRDDTLDLTVQDSGGTAIATVFARTAWTIETNATIKLYNANGSALAINVLETYYA